MGNQTDKIVAKKTQGIDVIIGLVIHIRLIKDVKEARKSPLFSGQENLLL